MAALQRGSLTMHFYANFTKGHELEEQKARPRENGEEQSLGEQPQGMNTIQNKSQERGRIKSGQSREHKRASQLRKVVHTDLLALANTCVEGRFFLTDFTFRKSMICILLCV